MSASLVGSEMCIRDRFGVASTNQSGGFHVAACASARQAGGGPARHGKTHNFKDLARRCPRSS
eukprot:5120021-Alexandrium_andersonii.AAC.2